MKGREVHILDLYDEVVRKLKLLWKRHWEILIVAILAFIVGKFILPMFFR